ncbi:MAG: hypothetical protein GXP62_05700 [Oligoflexia bacterium]|nr:hypothetical protein [Oligoflexia bacterium]
MKPQVPPPLCPFCNNPATLQQRLTRYRRGDMELAVHTWTWLCAEGCADPDTGQPPYIFLDPPLMRWNDQLAHRAWLHHYGEPMPPSRRGQRRGEKRTVRIPVLLTPTEAERLDKLRGDVSRSEFLRLALDPDHRKTG